MNPWTQVVGWTLIHFAWQGAALTVAAPVPCGSVVIDQQTPATPSRAWRSPPC
jgi:hypothetical protein